MTDIDRLKAWMERNGYDSNGLSRALGYESDWLKNILNGNRPFRNGLMIRMAALFGEDEMASVFADSLARSPLYVFTEPKKVAAQMAVAGAVRTKELLPAASHICVNCLGQAKQYHHQSYLHSDWLNVVPLCGVCHSRFHTAGMPLPTLGIVPTRVGIVRIAISYPN